MSKINKILSSLNEEKEDEILQNADIEDDTPVKSSINLKSKKPKIKFPKFNPRNRKSAEAVLKRILANLVRSAEKENDTVKNFILLAGDPGTGKTSLVRTLADVLGMHLVVIEAPHVTAEHIISIPYLIKRSNKTKPESGVSHIPEKGYEDAFDIKISEATINNEIRKLSKLPLISMDKLDKVVKSKYPNLYHFFDKNRDIIKELREKIKVILFIDELYRTNNNTQIQNALRQVINGRLGDSKLPKYVYPIFASNMSDTEGALDTIPGQHEFSQINFDKISTAGSFFNYMLAARSNIDPEKLVEIQKLMQSDPSKAEKEIDKLNMSSGRVKRNDEDIYAISSATFNAFFEKISDEVGGEEKSIVLKNNGIRISPRKMEQIMSIFDYRLSRGKPEDVQHIVDYIYSITENFQEETSSKSLQKLFKEIAVDILKENKLYSGEAKKIIDNFSRTPSFEWYNSMRGMIEDKMALGKQYRNIPVVVGRPGIAKTTFINKLVAELGLGAIIIDGSELTKEDVIGTPVVKRGVTTFTEPPLKKKIDEEYYEISKYIKPNKDGYIAAIFVDELNRPKDVEAFNAIRSLMLEKKYNESTSVSEDKGKVLIVAAVNPPTDESVMEFTDHMLDVVDPIPSSASTAKVGSFIEDKGDSIPNKLVEDYGIEMALTLWNTLLQFLERGRTPNSKEYDELGISDKQESYFFWKLDTDSDEYFWVSPRRLTETLADTYSQFSLEWKKDDLVDISTDKDAFKEKSEEVLADLIDIFSGTLMEKVENVLAVNRVDQFHIDNIVDEMEVAVKNYMIKNKEGLIQAIFANAMTDVNILNSIVESKGLDKVTQDDVIDSVSANPSLPYADIAVQICDWALSKYSNKGKLVVDLIKLSAVYQSGLNVLLENSEDGRISVHTKASFIQAIKNYISEIMSSSEDGDVIDYILSNVDTVKIVNSDGSVKEYDMLEYITDMEVE